MTRLELQLRREAGAGRYTVEVIQSAVGEGSGTMTLDVDDLLSRRAEWQMAILASAASTRRIVPETEQVLRELGVTLFRALFESPLIASRYRASIAVADERGEALGIGLRFDASELSPLPWEAMFDPELGRYICRREPLVRRVAVPSAPAPMPVDSALRILAVTASPRGLAVLDVAGERDRLTQALASRINSGAVMLRWVEDATWDAIHDLLLGDVWHVIHFVGHGDYNLERDEGVLALVGRDGRADLVDASRFADLLSEASPAPRLVILNACASATTSAVDLFAGTAAALVRSGVPAVAAMQFEVTDQAAIAFARGFYGALTSGRGVDEAVRSGRVSILGTSAQTLEWMTPVLYLRGNETQLFAVPRMETKPNEQHDGADATTAGPAEAVATTGHRTNAPDEQDEESSNPTETSAPQWFAEATFDRRSMMVSVSNIQLHLRVQHLLVLTSAWKDRFEIDGQDIRPPSIRLISLRKLNFGLDDDGYRRTVAITLTLPSTGPRASFYCISRLLIDGHDVAVKDDAPTLFA